MPRRTQDSILLSTLALAVIVGKMLSVALTHEDTKPSTNLSAATMYEHTSSSGPSVPPVQSGSCSVVHDDNPPNNDHADPLP